MGPSELAKNSDRKAEEKFVEGERTVEGRHSAFAISLFKSCPY
jgi:hypothetical protein